MTEILVVVAITGLLVALVLISIPAVLGQLNSMVAVSHARAIGQANLLFSMDYDERINGVGDWKSPDDPAEKGIVFRLAPYLSNQPRASLSWEEVWPIIRKFNDPNVPDHLTWLPETMRFAWAFNDSFSIEPGSGSLDQAPFRRMSEFPEPSRTIYAMSGIYVITREMADDPKFAKMPEQSWRIGPYVSYRDRIPTVFLDGRAELLKFPFDPNLIASEE